MKTIYYIFAAMLLVLSACTGPAEEPLTITKTDGKMPLAFVGVAPEGSRAEIQTLDGTKYDVYACAAAAKYYTIITNNSKDQLFFQMEYGTANDVVDGVQVSYDLFYLPGFYFPIVNARPVYMTIVTYGVEKGHTIPASVDPPNDQIRKNGRNWIEHMDLDLTAYDGTYDVIAADRMFVCCTPDLDYRDLPYGHFHHVMSRVDFKIKWADEVSASSPLRSRLTINSLKVENTPCQGVLRVGKMVDVFTDGPSQAIENDPNHDPTNPDKYRSYWTEEDMGDDVTFENTAADKHLPASGIEIGGSYIVPQAERQRIIINYTITNGTNTERTMNYVVRDKRDEANNIDDIAKGWLPGHRYTYTISIGDAGDVKIEKVDIEVSKFADGTVGTTDIY